MGGDVGFQPLGVFGRRGGGRGGSIDRRVDDQGVFDGDDEPAAPADREYRQQGGAGSMGQVRCPGRHHHMVIEKWRLAGAQTGAANGDRDDRVLLQAIEQPAHGGDRPVEGDDHAFVDVAPFTAGSHRIEESHTKTAVGKSVPRMTEMTEADARLPHGHLGDDGGELEMAVPQDGTSAFAQRAAQLLQTLDVDRRPPAAGKMVAQDLEISFDLARHQFAGDGVCRQGQPVTAGDRLDAVDEVALATRQDGTGMRRQRPRHLQPCPFRCQPSGQGEQGQADGETEVLGGK